MPGMCPPPPPPPPSTSGAKKKKGMKVLLVVADNERPKCSIYEQSKMVNETLRHTTLDVTTLDLGSSSSLPSPTELNEQYDVAIFVYHFLVMEFIPKEFFQALTIPRVCVNFETRNPSPWDTPSHTETKMLRELFDYVVVPGKNLPGENTLLIPRMIQRFDAIERPINWDKPVFSYFGFPNVFKDIVGQMDAVNREFEEGVFRLHVPTNSGAPESLVRHTANLVAECQRTARPGIEVVVTDHFMGSEELVEWLNQSDLNMFFYTRGRDPETRGTYPAAVDRAVAAQRPIAVQRWVCTEELLEYIDPYPEKNLRQLMEEGIDGVRTLYEIGDPEKVAVTLDTWLRSLV